MVLELYSHHLSNFFHFCDFVFRCDMMICVAWGWNASYSFVPNFLKLFRGKYGLKVCMLSEYNPHVILFIYLFFIFFCFFHFFFRPHYCQNTQLVYATSTVFYRLLWNFSDLFYMLWRCHLLLGLSFFFTNSFHFSSFWFYCLRTLLEGAIKIFKAHNSLLTKPWHRGTLARNGLLLVLDHC